MALCRGPAGVPLVAAVWGADGGFHFVGAEHLHGHAEESVDVAVLHGLAHVHAGVGALDAEEEEAMGGQDHPLVTTDLMFVSVPLREPEDFGLQGPGHTLQ